MSPVSRLLRHLGYVRLRDYGYQLTGEGRIVQVAELRRQVDEWRLEPLAVLVDPLAALGQAPAPAPRPPLPDRPAGSPGPVALAAAAAAPVVEPSIVLAVAVPAADAASDEDDEWQWRMAMARASERDQAEAGAALAHEAVELEATRVSPPASAPDLETAIRSVLPASAASPRLLEPPELEVTARYADRPSPPPQENPAAEPTADEERDWATAMARARQLEVDDAPRARASAPARPAAPVARHVVPSVRPARPLEPTATRSLSELRARASDPGRTAPAAPLGDRDRTAIRAAASTLTRRSVLPPRERVRPEASRRIARGTAGPTARAVTATGLGPNRAAFDAPTREIALAEGTLDRRDFDEATSTQVALTRVDPPRLAEGSQPKDVGDYHAGLDDGTERTLIGDHTEPSVDTAVLALPRGRAPLPRLSDRLRR